MVNPRESLSTIFDTNTPPNVPLDGGVPQARREEVAKPFGPFSQNLIGVPVSALHNLNYGVDIVV